MSRIEIVPVKGLGGFLNFSKTARRLYDGRKGFAPSLDAERWTLYAGKLNPHYAQVESQAWIARRDGKLVGRISAQVYKNGLKPVGASPAQFGCLDVIDDVEVAKGLLGAAEAWLRERGATRINGPFSPSVNSEIGVLVEGYDATPMIFMPWNPAYLPGLLEKCGYRKAKDVISYRYAVTAEDRADQPGIINRPEWRDRLKIRTIDLKTIKKEAEILVDIFNDAWSDNWGFVPFSFDEFMSVADSMKYLMPPEGGFIVELDGEPQAFGVILPNLHEITTDLGGHLFPLGLPKLISRLRNHDFRTARLALFGVRRALHRKAAGGAVILAFIQECRRRSRAHHSVDHVEFGWVLEDNMGMRRPIELSGAKIDKVHRIYEKDLIADVAQPAA